MAIVTVAAEARRRALQARVHRRCHACGPAAAGGLGVAYSAEPDGGVRAEWRSRAGDQGYDGVLHGGISATLLDGAMVHVLFAHDVVARTAELKLRYRQPVRVGHPVGLRAWLRRSYGPLYLLAAELRQDGRLCVTAEGRFMAVGKAES